MKGNVTSGYPSGRVFRGSKLARLRLAFHTVQDCSESKPERRTTHGRKSDAIADAVRSAATTPSETKVGIL